ncbi:MAG: glycosyltransferase, partial [Planctomycetaceae bacterium]|nr:glycosyltransferase [Planctomycetaceae bacterium]
MPTISIIIPVFNEEDSLKELHREISAVAEANQYQVEYVFVDGGSTDRSWNVLSEL